MSEKNAIDATLDADDALSISSLSSAEPVARHSKGDHVQNIDAFDIDSDDNEPSIALHDHFAEAHYLTGMGLPRTGDSSVMAQSTITYSMMRAYNEVDIDEVFEEPKEIVISPHVVGTVYKWVNDILTVKSVQDGSIINVGSFVSTSTTLIGPIISIFGPVDGCFYAVKIAESFQPSMLATNESIYLIKGTGSSLDQEIFSDNFRTATDASYINDEELPAFVKPDFSDDEEERHWRPHGFVKMMDE